MRLFFLKIDWFLFFRHRVIFGFYVKRKTMVTNTGAVLLKGGPWRPHWRWNWGDKFEWKIRTKRKKLPWHRCWNWGKVID